MLQVTKKGQQFDFDFCLVDIQIKGGQGPIQNFTAHIFPFLEVYHDRFSHIVLSTRSTQKHWSKRMTPPTI